MRAQHTVVQVVELKTKYPQGSEKQLVKAVVRPEHPVGRPAR